VSRHNKSFKFPAPAPAISPPAQSARGDDLRNFRTDRRPSVLPDLNQSEPLSSADIDEQIRQFFAQDPGQ
jgi:hypothetical protein